MCGKTARRVRKKIAKKFQVCRDRQMKRRISPATAITGGTADCRVVAGVVPGEGGVARYVVAGAGVVTVAGDGGTAVISGPVNCDREKPYTADASTAAITEPSPLTATERVLIGFLAVKEPSFVPARS